MCYISLVEELHINYGFEMFEEVYLLLQHICVYLSTARQTEKKAKKTNSGFQSNVRSLFHNLDYKREKAGGFLVIYTPLCVKKKGRNLLFFSSLSGWNTLG